jgi:hypothetical protein
MVLANGERPAREEQAGTRPTPSKVPEAQVAGELRTTTLDHSRHRVPVQKALMVEKAVAAAFSSMRRS